MQGLGDGVLILNPSETLLFKTAAFWEKAAVLIFQRIRL